jgi:hypothetical protein
MGVVMTKWVYRKSDGRFIVGGFYDAEPPMVGDPPSPDYVNYGVVEFEDSGQPRPTDVFEEELGKRPMTPEELALHFPPPVRKLSRFKFIQLMTPTEYLQLKALAAGGDTSVIYALEMLSLVEHVETGHPLVSQMLAYVVSINMMTQARADEIRDAFYAAAV